jgi:hypothetical protein
MLRYNLPLTPVARSWYHMPSCHVLPKALVRSIKHAYVALCALHESRISWSMKACSSVHRSLQKPVCSSGSLLRSFNEVVKWLSKTRSYTLDMHDVRDIGLYELASRGLSPPSLKIGRIIACCQIEGLIPQRKMRLNKEARAEIMESPPF